MKPTNCIDWRKELRIKGNSKFGCGMTHEGVMTGEVWQYVISMWSSMFRLCGVIMAIGIMDVALFCLILKCGDS